LYSLASLFDSEPEGPRKRFIIFKLNKRQQLELVVVTLVESSQKKKFKKLLFFGLNFVVGYHSCKWDQNQPPTLTFTL